MKQPDIVSFPDPLIQVSWWPWPLSKPKPKCLIDTSEKQKHNRASEAVVTTCHCQAGSYACSVTPGGTSRPHWFRIDSLHLVIIRLSKVHSNKFTPDWIVCKVLVAKRHRGQTNWDHISYLIFREVIAKQLSKMICFNWECLWGKTQKFTKNAFLVTFTLSYPRSAFPHTKS